jgi:hypothetical protein
MKRCDMDDPEWVKVLRVLYREEDKLHREIKGELSESHKLVKESGLKTEEVDHALWFLREQGLIEQEGVGHKELDTGEAQSTHIEYELTEKGFDVAHDRELRNQQETHNRVLAAFTVLVGISALVQAVSVVATESGLMQWILGFISVTGALAFVYVLKGRAEIFTE